MPQRLSLGYSPCPNDTFIFGGLALQAVQPEGLHLEPFLADVEVLNRKAREAHLDVTKNFFQRRRFLPQGLLASSFGRCPGARVRPSPCGEKAPNLGRSGPGGHRHSGAIDDGEPPSGASRPPSGTSSGNVL